MSAAASQRWVIGALLIMAAGLVLLGFTIHTWAYWSRAPAGVIFEPPPPAHPVQLVVAAVGALVLTAAVLAAVVSRSWWLIVLTGLALLLTLLFFVTVEQEFLLCLMSTADCSVLVNTG